MLKGCSLLLQNETIYRRARLISATQLNEDEEAVVTGSPRSDRGLGWNRISTLFLVHGRSNSWVSVSDGDHHEQAPSTQPASPHIHSSSKEVKNTHALVKEVVEHSDRTWADSTANWPGFVHLLGLEDEGMNDCLTPSL